MGRSGRQTAGGGPYDTTEPWHVECLPGWTAPVAISVVTKTPGATRWLHLIRALPTRLMAESVLTLARTSTAPRQGRVFHQVGPRLTRGGGLFVR